MDIIFRNN